MSPRESRVNDYWRHALTRTYPTRFESIASEGLSCLADGTIRFAPGITAIVGGNGVGKSTLIRAVSELLSNARTAQEQTHIARSTLRGTAYSSGTEVQMAVALDENGTRAHRGARFEGNQRWLDPSALAQQIVQQVRRDANFDELLEGVTPTELSASEIKMVSYLVGKEYAAWSVYEISDYSGMERFPYFRVTSLGDTYGSENMGKGELALSLTYWTLRDMNSNGILVIEEPETHVSPRSQDHLMNVLAQFCGERAISVIMATHSPVMIRKIPRENLRLLVRGGGRASVVENASPILVRTLLSGGVAFKGVLLVEDVGAKYFLLTLIEELAPELLPEFEVVPAGSHSRISQALQSFPKTAEWLTIIGVYDGGIEATLRAEGVDIARMTWPAVLLPGEAAPELLLKGLADGGASRSDLAVALEKTEPELNVAIDHVAGVDHHDWVREFARALGRDVAFVRQRLTHSWIAAHRAVAIAFIEQLRLAIVNITRST